MIFLTHDVLHTRAQLVTHAQTLEPGAIRTMTMDSH